MAKKSNKIPTDIEMYVDNSVLFNKFGLININALRATTKTELSNDEIKKLINERFAHEITGEIEFMEK